MRSPGLWVVIDKWGTREPLAHVKPGETLILGSAIYPDDASHVTVTNAMLPHKHLLLFWDKGWKAEILASMKQPGAGVIDGRWVEVGKVIDLRAWDNFYATFEGSNLPVYIYTVPPTLLWWMTTRFRPVASSRS